MENSPQTLSFRDQCAIAAIQASLTACDFETAGDIFNHEFESETAFDIADAMEAERQKRSAVPAQSEAKLVAVLKEAQTLIWGYHNFSQEAKRGVIDRIAVALADAKRSAVK